MSNLYRDLFIPSNSALSERELFYSYRNNNVLQKAISGEQKIEDALADLARIDQPTTRLFPRRKDEVRNAQIRELEELVGNLDRIKSNGFFYLDNFISGSASTFLLTGVLYGSIGYVVDSLQLPEINRLANESIIQGVIGANLLASAFIFGPASQLSRIRKIPFEQAKSLDGRIQELYRCPSIKI